MWRLLPFSFTPCDHELELLKSYSVPTTLVSRGDEEKNIDFTFKDVLVGKTNKKNHLKQNPKPKTEPEK